MTWTKSLKTQRRFIGGIISLLSTSAVMETIRAKAKDEGVERGSKKASDRSLHTRAWFDIALIRNRGGLVGPSRRNQYVQRDNRDCDPP